MSQTLYRKYRPKNFSEVIGQTHIVRTLSNSVRNNRIGHAYLFTGPRGTGKTSIARIFAKTVNCKNLKGAQTCEKCPSCKIVNSGKSMDIIEIDAASNTGVDNIRELRETVSLATASLGYKVYIIDEVHMLSTGAFNALLKTLEEPPSHVIFILATTEIHKVPETIISRCQRFDFSRLPIESIIEKLSLIAKAEKVKIAKEALEMIAISAEGGMRDAESLLGQIITLEDKNITVSEVEEILGTADKKTSREVARLILEKDSTAAISKINELLENGYDLQVFAKSLVNYLRQLMLLKIDKNLEKHFSFEITREQAQEMARLAETAELHEIISAINLLLEAQNKISAFMLPQLPLEIAIIKATRTFPKEKSTYEIQKQDPREKLDPKLRSAPKDSNIKGENQESEKIIKAHEVAGVKPNENAFYDAEIDMEMVRGNWKKLLTDIRPCNHSLSALLSNCQPMKIEHNSLTLGTPYDFYRERLNDTKNRLTVEEVFSKILGSPIRINVELDKSLVPKKEEPTDQKEESSSDPASSTDRQDSLLQDAMEIMGGQIVEEA